MEVPIEAWLAIVAFGLLMTLWLLLPSRLIHRNRENYSEPKPVPSPRQMEIPVEVGRAGTGVIYGRKAVHVRLIRNPAFSLHTPESSPRYYFVVRLEGLLGVEEARVPVYWRPNPATGDLLLKEVYGVEVAGRRLQAGNLQALQALLIQAVGELIHSHRFPRYWLVPPDGRAIPIFQENGRYEAITPEGPRLIASDLTRLRQQFCHYLAQVDEADLDLVSVTALSPLDLQIHHPIAVLEGEGIWIPIFRLGSRLFAEGPGRAQWTCEDGPEALLRLWDKVSEALCQERRLPNPIALRVRDVAESIWEELVQVLQPAELTFAAVLPASSDLRRMKLSVWRWRELYLCRREGRRFRLYAALDPWELCTQVGMDLYREGLVGSAEDLLVQSNSIAQKNYTDGKSGIAFGTTIWTPGKVSDLARVTK